MVLPKHTRNVEDPNEKFKITYKKTDVKDPFQSYEMVSYLIDAKKIRHRKFLATQRLSFSIGLFLSFLLVVGLFEWKSSDRSGSLEIAGIADDFEELMDIPVTEQPPPPPVKKIQQPNIVEVEVDEIIEEIEIDFDVEITEETVIEEFDSEGLELMEEEEADEIFTIVEVKPEPQGGMAAFMSFIAKNIKYPDAALRTRVQGKVFVQFVVNSDGSLVDIEVIKGIGGGCDEEAVRVISKAPNWIPGKQRGKPVRVRMMAPVFFKLKER
ncbi:energy transducer TonB [Fulvivirga sp. M361]|uniref:energy transducer TonB n=1 Tax=Fulvivirga sp. M361 TaxID=2594266 RepID=UPI00351B2DAA